MIQELKYNGVTAVPSDYECQDGDLSVSIGMVPEDGALRLVLPPKKMHTFSSDETAMFIHKTTEFSHYIVYKTNGAIISYDSTSWEKLTIGSLVDVTHFNAIGNTLIAFSSTQGIFYYLWKDKAYHPLGSHIPEVALSFGLIGHPKFWAWGHGKDKGGDEPSFDFEDGKIKHKNLYNELSETEQNNLTSSVMAHLNKIIADETVNNGRFCFPFFVRYAIRLYDGTLTMQSAPILMCPSTGAPLVWWDIYNTNDDYFAAKSNGMIVAADIDYAVNSIYSPSGSSYTNFTSLSDWSDIVKSVDIFITKPIYTYDQSGKIKRFFDNHLCNTAFIGKLAKADSSGNNMPKEDCILGTVSGTSYLWNNYAEIPYTAIFRMYHDWDVGTVKTDGTPGGTGKLNYSYELPQFSEKSLEDSLDNAFTFYKLSSIDVKDITVSSARKQIEIAEDYLQSLVNREVLTDDYQTHDQLYAKYSYGFNARLNLSGVERKPFEGFTPACMFPHINVKLDFRYATSETVTVGTNSSIYPKGYLIETHIKENGETYSVRSTSSTVWPYLNGGAATSWGTFLFYPNTNAYEMIICEGSYSNPVYKVSLKAHEFLNGAFTRLDFNKVRTNNVQSYDLITPTSALINTPNKIYTSEVNNPFFFPLTGINTVGTGEIMGICSAVKALSQGQFGQFPLYAFSTDGVWSLEVSSTGTYKTKQPVTRDVCINPDSITQLDSSVLFATDRGIMEIAGSKCQCITEVIDSDSKSSNPSGLANIAKLVAVYNDWEGGDGEIALPTEGTTIVPFKEYLKHCRTIYDYTNQRLIVYNTTKDYSYVYSMKSSAWGMMLYRVTDHLNSYPNAVALSDANLVDFSVSDKTSGRGIVITRPFKLGDLNLLKTIDTVIQRGTFVKTHIQQVLYGSEDLNNWHAVWSSTDKYMRGFRGTPYRYFRLAFVCKFDQTESIYGASVQFSPRMTNRPR